MEGLCESILPSVPDPSIFRYVTRETSGIREFPFEVSVTLITEMKKECSAGCLDLLLRFRQVINHAAISSHHWTPCRN